MVLTPRSGRTSILLSKNFLVVREFDFVINLVFDIFISSSTWQLDRCAQMGTCWDQKDPKFQGFPLLNPWYSILQDPNG